MTAPNHKTKPAQPLTTKPAPSGGRKGPSPVPDQGGLDQFPKRKTLMQRTAKDCCWPITAGAPWFYCGERVQSGQSYCQGHMAARRDAANPTNGPKSVKQLIRSVGRLR